MGKLLDLTGLTFGEWEVLSYDGDKYWNCKCSCGTEKKIHGYDLRTNKSKSCGHSSTGFKDLTNMQIGEWSILEYSGNAQWLCECSCGETRNVSSINLLNNRSKSCGHSVNKFKDLKGKQLGEWYVISYAGDGKWNCICSCGKEKVVGRSRLIDGTSKSCGHDTTAFKDLTGMTFGELKVLRYDKNSKWICECTCGKEYKVHRYALISGRIESCGHNTTAFKDLTGMKFGELEVLEYINKKWNCECSCGRIKTVSGYKLRSGKTQSCGHAKTNKELLGLKYGEWEVIDTLNNPYIICKCSCGTIKTLNKYDLIHNRTKSCGHRTDLTNIQFGEWKVLSNLHDRYWECKCSCGNIRSIQDYSLVYGLSKSCGCKTTDNTVKTNLEKYGVKYINQRHRTTEQIAMTDTKENLLKTILENFKDKPTARELVKLTGLTPHRILTIIHSFDISNFISLNKNVSHYEDMLNEMFNCANRSDRAVLDGRELDLYYPEQRFAIEFNGDYWHSSTRKPKRYHQEKTIECAKQGIRLFHVFEYEWNNENKREKIIKQLDKILNTTSNSSTIYGRDTKVCIIENKEAVEFCNKYHLQNGINSSVNIALKFKDDIVGVMTFGRPRFGKGFEWELFRLCYKDDVTILGGSEKMFKYFIRQFNPQSIISYCDIAKFSGKVYKKLGFKATADDITEPNYVWVDSINNIVLTRYQTQKHKLLENELGRTEQTEDEIMKELGYLKIHDCGNLRFTWSK